MVRVTSDNLFTLFFVFGVEKLIICSFITYSTLHKNIKYCILYLSFVNDEKKKYKTEAFLPVVRPF